MVSRVSATNAFRSSTSCSVAKELAHPVRTPADIANRGATHAELEIPSAKEPVRACERAAPRASPEGMARKADLKALAIEHTFAFNRAGVAGQVRVTSNPGLEGKKARLRSGLLRGCMHVRSEFRHATVGSVALAEEIKVLRQPFAPEAWVPDFDGKCDGTRASVVPHQDLMG